MTTTWLIDTSALARASKLQVAQVLAPRVDAGLIGICVVTELELGFSARSLEDHDQIRGLVDRLVPVLVPARAERTAVETQRRLVEAAQHRAVAVPDLLVAAVAATSGLTVLHYDGDFDLIASLTGQPTEWVVPSGEAD